VFFFKVTCHVLQSRNQHTGKSVGVLPYWIHKFDRAVGYIMTIRNNPLNFGGIESNLRGV